MKEHVRARFVSSGRIHHNGTEKLLQTTPPTVISALYTIYPVIIASNRFLSFITWTTPNYYRNFVLISIYTLLLLFWNKYLVIILPTLVTLIFCCFAWFIKQCFIDIKPSESLEEILNTVDNFTMRCEFLFGIHNTNNTQSKRFGYLITQLFINIALLTPFYVFIMKNYITWQTWLISVSLFFVFYYTTWFISLRKILWRLKTIRRITNFLTGEPYSMEDKEIEVTLINLNTKNTEIDNTKIIEFELLENERRWIGLGWCKKLLFFERRPYCSLDFKHSYKTLDEFQFPSLNSYKNSEWKWLDNKWKSDPAVKSQVSSHGWIYYDNYWENGIKYDSVTRYTRSRRISRRCLVILQK